MTIEQRIIQHLRAAGTVGVRVFGGILPQGATMPALTIQRISGMCQHTHSEGRSLMRSRMQVAVWASTYESAVETSKSMRAAMDSFTMSGAGGRARLLITMDLGREADSTLFQTITDYEILHNE